MRFPRSPRNSAPFHFHYSSSGLRIPVAPKPATWVQIIVVLTLLWPRRVWERSDVVTAVEEVGGEGVAKGVAGGLLVGHGLTGGRLDGALDSGGWRW